MRTAILVFLIGSLFTASAAAGDEERWVPEQLVCILYDGYDIVDVNKRWGTTTIWADVEENFYLLRAAGVQELPAFVVLFRKDEAVELADPNYWIETPEAQRQMVIGAVGGTWGDFEDQELTHRIGLSQAHDMVRGAGITVAVLDTGYDPDHEIFADRISDYVYDCIDLDQTPYEEADGFDNDGDGFVDEGYGHGTMVAGLVALVAPDATLMPIRVLDDEGRGTLFSVTKGIMCAVPHGADILSMSFGVPVVTEIIAEKLRVAENHGVVTIAAAGNRNVEEPPLHPACDSLAIMVTAVDSLDMKAGFADYHTDVVVSAPGVGVRSAYPGNEWGIGSGCSFAAPLVAGEAALVLEQMPGIERPELTEHLERGAQEIYDIPENWLYRGLLGSGRMYIPWALGVPISDAPESVPFAALRAWPNPSRGTVYLELPIRPATSPAQHQARIHDANGRLVRTLPLTGEGRITWFGRDQAGRRVSPGRYFISLPMDDSVQTSCITMLR